MSAPCNERAGSPLATVRSKVVTTNYFEVFGVDDSELLVETYRIRYQVYCVERGFLSVGDYPQDQEMDGFDDRSIHVLARHRNGVSAGTARLVLYSPSGFPMQSHCSFDQPYAYLRERASPALTHYSEISRLAVSKLFRRRADDTFYGGAPRTLLPNQAPLVSPTSGPEIVTGIYKYLYQESKQLGITHWLVAMERGLDLMLRRMGFRFIPVGPEIDYYGPVRPYMASIEELERTVSQRYPQMFAYMSEGLAAGACRA